MDADSMTDDEYEELVFLCRVVRAENHTPAELDRLKVLMAKHKEIKDREQAEKLKGSVKP